MIFQIRLILIAIQFNITRLGQYGMLPDTLNGGSWVLPLNHCWTRTLLSEINFQHISMLNGFSQIGFISNLCRANPATFRLTPCSVAATYLVSSLALPDAILS